MKKSKQIILSAVLLSAVVAKGQTRDYPQPNEGIYTRPPVDSMQIERIPYEQESYCWTYNPWNCYVNFNPINMTCYGPYYYPNFGYRRGGFGHIGHGHFFIGG